MAKAQSVVAIPAKIGSFIREAREELKKVAWPSRETTLRYTLIVVIASLAIGLLIGGIDYLLTLLIEEFVI